MGCISSIREGSQHETPLQLARRVYFAAAIAMAMGPAMEQKRAAYDRALRDARAEEDRRDPFAFHRNFKRREEVGWERFLRRNPGFHPAWPEFAS